MIDALTAKQAVIKWRCVIGCRCMRMAKSCSCWQSAPGLCLMWPHMMGAPWHCRWGADYLLKTLVFDTTDTTNLTGLIYQVGNLTTDSLFWGRPEDITMKRPYYVASADSMSDLGEASL